MNESIIYNILGQGESEQYLRIWPLYGLWVMTCILYPFVVMSVRKKGIQTTKPIKTYFALWMHKHPIVFGFLNLGWCFPLIIAWSAYNRDLKQLENGKYLTYQWKLIEYIHQSSTGGRASREIDRLVVGSANFTISCSSTLRSRIGGQGTCLPVEIGDVLRIDYSPSESVGSSLRPLRIWKMPQDAISLGPVEASRLVNDVSQQVPPAIRLLPLQITAEPTRHD